MGGLSLWHWIIVALVILVSALAYMQWAARRLGIRQAAGAAGSA